MDLTNDALTTIAAVEEALSIDAGQQDESLARLINAASDQIRRFCNRRFFFAAGIVELVTAHGTPNLIVSRRPITTITQITFDGSLVSSDDYKSTTVEKFAEAGIIFNRSGWFWAANRVRNIARDVAPGTEDPLYEVTYDGGWITPAQDNANNSLTRDLPFDLEQAAIDLAVHLWRSRPRDENIKSEKLMSWAATYRETPKEGIPVTIQARLNPYVTQAMA